MKRKLALLLAVAMIISMLPMSVFGASGNKVTATLPNIPVNTAILESNLTFNYGAGSVKDQSNRNPDLDGWASGGDLIIRLTDAGYVGNRIRIELDNAVWFFRNTDGSKVTTEGSLNFNGTTATVAAPGAGAFSLRDYGTLAAKNNATLISEALASVGASTLATEKYPIGREMGHSNSARTTYDPTRGVYYPSSTNSKSGVYIRTDVGPNRTTAVTAKGSVPYILSISPADDRVAVLTILGLSNATSVYGTATNSDSFGYYNDAWDICVPLVTRTTVDGKNISVKVSDTQGTEITTGSYVYAYSVAGATNTYVSDPQTMRSRFKLNSIVISETRIGSVKNGTFYLQAPAGFTFDAASVENVKLRNTVYAGTTDEVKCGITLDPGLEAAVGGFSATIVPDSYKDVYGNVRDDYGKLNITLSGVKASETITGRVYITGLELVADEGAPWGPFNLSISSSDSTVGITSQSFLAGDRQDWKVALTAITTPTELINGRYKAEQYYQNNVSTSDAIDDQYHKSASVRFTELSLSAWWAERETIFTLPEGVAFRKVKITKWENVDNPTGISNMVDKVFYNRQQNAAKETIDVAGRYLTFNNLKLVPNKKALVEMDLWLSVEAGFTGDIQLSVEGSAVYESTSAKCVIAKAINPITIDTTVTDVKIGYQYQKTADIKLTETKPGNLLKGKEVRLSLTDGVSTDMVISPDVKVSTNEAESGLKVSTLTQGYRGLSNTTVATGTVGGNGISFTIERQSAAKVGVINLENVWVKVDRDVPQTNYRPYEVVVWGSAIAPNYINWNYNPDGEARDKFQVPGVVASYAKVVSSANDLASVLTQKVEVPVGKDTYKVNGIEYKMDAKAYISTRSNSTMVPVRFTAYAFGLGPDQVIWDDVEKTVTLFANDGKIIQFKVDSDAMIVNGVKTVMTNTAGQPVYAENVNGRVYIPFRALGNAFGIPVSWEEATQTAIYNKDAIQ